jgi:Ca-activated chloride channel family protein
MNDNLDKKLEAWKEQRSPKDAQFTSEEKFTSDFFEKAAQLPAEKVAKKTFWPIVCKLAACLVVVLCLAVMLLKQNKKNETAVARNGSLTKNVQVESVETKKEQNDEVMEAVSEAAETKPVMMNVAAKRKEADSDDRAAMKERRAVSMALKPLTLSVESMTKQAEEVDETVAETVASQPVMAKAILKAKLADSDSDLTLMASKPASLPVTAPMANAPIVVNDDAIALDGNGELVMLKAKQKGNMTISRDDGKEVNILGYYETNCELADIVLENQTVDYSKLQFDKMSISSSDAGDLDTSLIVDGDTIAGNAYAMTDVLKSADLTIDRGDVKNNVENLNIEANTIANADVAANRVGNISNHITYDTLIDGNIADTANILSGVRADDAGVVALNISRSTNIVAPPIMNNDMNDGWMANPISQNTEEYKDVSEKPFLAVITNPLSTFGADVDTAGYGMMRRMILQEKRLPTPNTVRIEELLNYFHYDYPMPEKDDMMRPHFEMQTAPWNSSHQLLLVGVQAKTVPVEELPSSHYVFLIDNSGSMEFVFPMVKDAMTALARQLRKGDIVSMVTYGGGVNILLEAAWDPEVVCAAIAKLHADGFTPGGAGIQMAYQMAERYFIKGGNNRIVLITDGDFNVGTSSEAELVEMVEAKQKLCIYLTVVGCGMGNYKDNKMKMLANKGNGNYFYLDEPREARKIFVKGMTGNMVTICRDVKFQLEFNPSKVFAYRQLGYELRAMASSDFRNDAKDSGEVGMGQQVTVLYELVPAEASEDIKKQAVPGWQPLKYAKTEAIANDELLTFRMRYKLPQGDAPAVEKMTALTTVPTPTSNWNWASSVAEFALRLRRSPFAGDANYDRAVKRAQTALGDDADGQRAEFLLLIHRVQELDAK